MSLLQLSGSDIGGEQEQGYLLQLTAEEDKSVTACCIAGCWLTCWLCLEHKWPSSELVGGCRRSSQLWYKATDAQHSPAAAAAVDAADAQAAAAAAHADAAAAHAEAAADAETAAAEAAAEADAAASCCQNSDQNWLFSCISGCSASFVGVSTFKQQAQHLHTHLLLSVGAELPASKGPDRVICRDHLTPILFMVSAWCLHSGSADSPTGSHSPCQSRSA